MGLGRCSIRIGPDAGRRGVADRTDPDPGTAGTVHPGRLRLSRFAVPLVIAGREDTGDFTGCRLDRVLAAHARDLDRQPYRPFVTTEPDDPVGRSLHRIQEPARSLIQGAGDGDIDFVPHTGTVANVCS